jgi:hypothetical protein
VPRGERGMREGNRERGDGRGRGQLGRHPDSAWAARSVRAGEGGAG